MSQLKQHAIKIKPEHIHYDSIVGLFQCFKCEHWYGAEESNVFKNDTLSCLHIHLCNACYKEVRETHTGYHS